MNYKSLVKEALEKSKLSRDDDGHLYNLVLTRLQFDVLKNTANDLIVQVREKQLPSYDSITRLRRMVQMENVFLRGEDWDVRHGIKVEKALTDLGYVNA